MKTIILLFFAVFLFINSATSQIPPTVEWKNVTHRDKDIYNNPVTQNLSGDEWWYSHKNLYDNSNTQIGYVAVGYIADIVHPGDENQMRTVFNEGANSCYNLFAPTGSLFNSANIRWSCDDLIDGFGAGTNTDGNESRTEFRGMVARLDMKGNMIWCRVLTFVDLQEVVEYNGFIYVIGTNVGAMKMNKSAFLNYNPSSSDSSNVFDKSINPSIICPPGDGGVGHMYVAKLDLNGNRIWEGLYGNSDFNVDPNEAWNNPSGGFDLILNSNGSLYCVGKANTNTTAPVTKGFIVQIDPTTGFLQNKSLLNLPVNLTKPYAALEARSICEIGNNNMAIAGKGDFIPGGPNPNQDTHRGVIYSIDQNLNLNTGWATNPLDFVANSGAAKTTNIWEINYHTAKNEILVGLITNCDFCAFSGANYATGQILRLNPINGLNSTIGTNPSNMGAINAYDLRIGVTETTDGGFAAVSARRNVTTFIPPTTNELGIFASCSEITSPNGGYNSNYTNGAYGYWDTDPLIVKFNASGVKQWEWSEDVVLGRPRQTPPGDLKRQECMYKISQAQDGGLVISGNASFNHDDDYMVKLKSDCQTTTLYDYNPDPNGNALVIPLGQTVTWNSSKKIHGKIKITGGTLIINGANTTIEFADSAYTGVYSGIEVGLQGKININGAHLTSLSSCPTQGMWNGIVLLGDYLTAQNFQPSFGNYFQPVINLNNATISNARHAIITGKVAPVNSSAGGIVKVFNSNFKNNYIDVEFIAYGPNVGTTNTNNDLGTFYNTTFLSDNFLNDPAFIINGAKISNKIHVKLNGNKGIQFTGCAFKTDVSGPLSAVATQFRGTGIKSFNSTFNAYDYCVLSNPNGCAQYSGNAKFENLETGIIAASSNVLQNYRVENVNFNNCYKGIYQSGVNYSTVQNNKFTVNSPVPAPTNGCSSIINQRVINGSVGNGLCTPVQYYVLGSDAFKHANNQYLVAASLPAQNVFGTLFNFCNGGSNFSYRNSYTNMQRGHQLQAGNNNLQIKCNTNISTKAYDVSVTSGIISQQGGCINQLAPPNNLFSHLGTTESDIKSVSNFQYNFIPNPSNGFQIALYKSNTITNFPCVISQPFNYAQSCPTEQNPGCGAGCRTIQINNLQTQIDQDNALLTAGAAATLITVINTQSPGQVKNALLAKSPYLSDAVLITYLSTNPPNGHVKNVIEANQPVTAPVWQEVINAGLPNGIFNQLQNGQTGTSGRTQLEQTIQQLILDKKNNINEAVALVLNPADSITNYVQAETFLKMDNTGEYYDDLANLYFITKQFTEAQNYIDLLNKDPENKDLVSFLNIALLSAQENDNWQDVLLLSDNLDKLNKLALNVNTIGSSQAQVIRGLYIADEFFNFVEDFASPDGSRLFTGKQTTTDTPLILSNNGITVFPNPFAEQLKVSYNFEAGLAGGIMQIIEAGSGRLFYESTFNGLSGEQIINTSQLNKGFYIIKVQQNQNKPVYFKIINTN